MLSTPLNIPKWLEQNSHLLKPPINNYCVYDGDMTVMIVGGPNARSDYHINTTPEWFYQYRGSMLLKVVDTDTSKDTPDETSNKSQFKDIPIREGEMFLLPPNTPHNPIRFADTVGIVLELKRPEGSVDKLRWYCQSCGRVVYEDAFHCTDLGTQIKDAVNKFEKSPKRLCGDCGEWVDMVPRDVVQP